PPELNFFEWGVCDFDGLAEFRHLGGNQYTISNSIEQSGSAAFQVYKLGTIMEKLGHRKVDLLKMNIEGGEYRVIADMLSSQLDVVQLVLEFHHRLPGFNLAQTKVAVDALNQQGYEIFNISDGKEYSFLRTSRKAF